MIGSLALIIALIALSGCAFLNKRNKELREDLDNLYKTAELNSLCEEIEDEAQYAVDSLVNELGIELQSDLEDGYYDEDDDDCGCY